MTTNACELADWPLLKSFGKYLPQCSTKKRECYHALSVLSIGEAVVYDDDIKFDRSGHTRGTLNHSRKVCKCHLTVATIVYTNSFIYLTKLIEKTQFSLEVLCVQF